MQLLEEHRGPIFDYVFVDGAHTWAHDALAFLLVDRLLRPGGYVDFDDYTWTLRNSPSMNPAVFPEVERLYTDDQIDTAQVALVVDLLVKPDPSLRGGRSEQDLPKARPMTRVSVCIPTRNQARYLATAVESALGQPVEDLEVVVHDDASTDETGAVLAGFGDPRLRTVRHPEPLGIAASRNALLEDARGEYIAWLDSDDRYTNGSLARRLRLLDDNPGVGLVHGAFDLIDDYDRPLRGWPAVHEGDTLQRGEVAFRELLQSNTITTSTVVARRSAHEAAGPFSEAVGRTSSDWEMWLRIALRADIAYTASVVASYRQHAGSISRSALADGERLRADIGVTRNVLRHERRRIPNLREAERLARDSLAAKAISRAGELHTAGHRRDATAAILLALRLAPRAGGSRRRQAPHRSFPGRRLRLLPGDEADQRKARRAARK